MSKARWDNLTKPPGSLGRLEEMVDQYEAIRGREANEAPRKGMYIFCGDHGVTAEGVSPYPSEITALMVRNFLKGGAAINVLCRQYGIETTIVDCGVNSDVEAGVVDRKIGRGTRNFLKEQAMSREEAETAIQNGIELARAAEYDVAGVGEMGIGNTTAASALSCILCGLPPCEACGRGTGLDDAGVAKKVAVVEQALARHPVTGGVSALAAVGGFEIATMTGFMLGAAQSRLPVMVDGFIATSAALAAVAIEPKTRDALLFAHCSAELAHRKVLAHLGAKPLLELDMRLGEGSAAAIGIGLLDTAIRLYREMATFQDLA
jgi:nicotinate-nucleotide--dimethylbenzimidazole phosphoribosyltransferase